MFRFFAFFLFPALSLASQAQVSTERLDSLRDPCEGVTCPPNSECSGDGASGECHFRCNDGFLVVGQECVENPCATLERCPLDNAECRPEMGAEGKLSCMAFCNQGFVLDQEAQLCVSTDPCASVECPLNANCRATDGECRAFCAPGFAHDGSNGCAPASTASNAANPGASGARKGGDACGSATCPLNMQCEDVDGECVGSCVNGYTYDRESRSCISSEKLARLCPAGYFPNAERTSCLPINPCVIIGMQCPANAICRPSEDNRSCNVACAVGHSIDHVTRGCVPSEQSVSQ